MIVALDLATRLCGYCAGRGDKVPVADAFKLAQHGEDIGAMLVELDANVDSLLTRRKLFNVAGHVEFMCAKRGISCAEEEVRTIKRELSGSTKASKDDMVRAAEKVGVRLPTALSDGREDAADAFGCWLLGLRHQDRTLSARWDRVLYSSRGALL